MKYLILLILFISTSFASSAKFIEEMKYETVYTQALQKAKSQDKILMMVATTQSCPWCRKFERQTLSKDEINSEIKSNFIALSVDQELKNFPSQFEVKVVPTIYFINPKDESVLAKILGYKNKIDFKEILDEVKTK